MAEKKHKGNFVGGHFYEDEMEVVEMVMDGLEEITGKRNQAEALRYIVRNFPVAALPGKADARAAQPFRWLSPSHVA